MGAARDIYPCVKWKGMGRKRRGQKRQAATGRQAHLGVSGVSTCVNRLFFSEGGAEMLSTWGSCVGAL